MSATKTGCFYLSIMALLVFTNKYSVMCI